MNQHSRVPEYLVRGQDEIFLTEKVRNLVRRDFTALLVDLDQLLQESIKAQDLCTNTVNSLRVLVQSLEDI